jgi:hypothetical protein
MKSALMIRKNNKAGSGAGPENIGDTLFCLADN